MRLSAGELRPAEREPVGNVEATPRMVSPPEEVRITGAGVWIGAMSPTTRDPGMRADQTVGCGTGGVMHCNNAQEAHSK